MTYELRCWKRIFSIGFCSLLKMIKIMMNLEILDIQLDFPIFQKHSEKYLQSNQEGYIRIYLKISSIRQTDESCCWNLGQSQFKIKHTYRILDSYT
jgi:hypothetical protein